ncbi:MAG: tetratricopeptide repeat protein [Chlamydiales bacterium]|nr:tetratricopeptide repeat protein [Chlamydiales bacterium]
MKKLLWAFLLSLAFFPYQLSAGFFDWFYTSPDKVSQFECPHHCGVWGTEGVRQVEWKALLVMWELDRFAHAIQDIPFPYQNVPRKIDDPWVDKFKKEGLSLEVRIATKNVLKPRYNRAFYLEEERWDGCTEDWWASWHKDQEGNDEGIELFSDLRLYENNKKFDSYDISFQFDSMSKVQDFCFSVQVTLKDRLLDDSCYFWSCYDQEAIDVIKTHKRITEIIDGRVKENEKFIQRFPLDYRMEKWLEKREELAKDHETNNRDLEEAKRIRENLKVTIDRIRTSMDLYYPRIEARLGDVKHAYCFIFDHCIAHHNAPEAYYQRALYHYSEGLNINCIEDIKKLIEMTPPEMLTEKMQAKLEFRKGKAECELDLFEDAILTLSSYIENHPRHRQAYLERAIAYFETGDFHQALQDFAETGFQHDPIPPSMLDELEFSTGLVKGLTIGGGESIADFVPSAISSLSGLSHGIISFTLSPQEVSREFYQACKNVIEVIKDNGLIEVLEPFFPEIQELNNNHALSYIRQGELVGHLVGRFGAEVLLIRTGVKGITAYRDLRQANAILTLKKMSTSALAEQQIVTHSRKWWSKTKPIINELKAKKGAKIDVELFRAFRNQCLSEAQIRRILHHAGYETFPRPKGVPVNCIVEISEKKGGMRFRKLGTVEDECILIRVMPGNPKSPYPVQRSPYVVQRKGDSAISKSGKFVKLDSEDAHIPLDQYEFKGWYD